MDRLGRSTRTSSRSCPACASVASASPRCTRRSIRPLPASARSSMFAALAEFIRELIVQGTNEGLGAASARGARLGRPPAMTGEQVRHARDLRAMTGSISKSCDRRRQGCVPATPPR
ncbi:hypothetical protein [Streptomyces sp. NBC_01708]|uniref:hypothetical protein n=1 Tax=Streptomyces sp. NBC_01708 TaxID=2975915 RepID=UPI002E3163DD|nr:hypothetical protein [Streptomyces sp. NBC_01708]